MSDKAFDMVASLVKSFERVLHFVPDSIKAETYDIRLKTGQPLMLCGKKGILFITDKGGVSKHIGHDTLICRHEDMRDVFLHICSHSVFSHENEINEGFVTAPNGCRIGLCGTAVIENEKIKNIKDFSTLVFRIPREKRGCADVLFRNNVDFSKGVLIVGEPSSGKTTLLRDICTSLASGIHSQAKRIAVLDERCEVSGNFQIGAGADVLKGYPKQFGFTMALRTLSPEIIVCDELSDKDLDSAKNSFFCGVPVISTIHGNERDLKSRKELREILEYGGFETIVFLKGRQNPTEILKIESAGDLVENIRRNDDSFKRACDRNDEVS